MPAASEFSANAVRLNALCVAAGGVRPEFTIDAEGLMPDDERALAGFPRTPGGPGRLRIACAEADLRAHADAPAAQALLSALETFLAPPAPSSRKRLTA